MDSIIVGIDVSKDRLDVAVRPSGEAFAVERNAAGLEAAGGNGCATLAPHIVALEATGGFETVAAAALAAAGLPVVVVNPAQVRAFAKAIGQRAKTDPIDAAVIAHFAEATKPRAAAAARRGDPAAGRSGRPPAADHRDDRGRAPAREARHDRRVCRRASPGSSRRWRRSSPASTPTSTMPCAARRPGARRRTCSPPCRASGPIIARTLIAELPELGTPRPQADRSPRRPCALHPPVRPVARQELHRRRPHERCAPPCSWAPWSPSGTTPSSRPSSTAWSPAGKPKMVALIAVARKLLTILNAILRDKQPWQNA